MKKIKLLSIVFATIIPFTNCKKKEDAPAGIVWQQVNVTKKNMSMVNKFTGSNCPPLGTWCWTMFEELIANNPANTCNIGAYSQNFVA